VVEINTIQFTPKFKLKSQFENFVNTLESPPKLHLTLVFLLLEKFIERRKFTFSDLRGFQVEGIQLAVRDEGIFLVAPTGSGKTVVAYIFLGLAIVRGHVGVYLVPHTQLLDQKVHKLREFFGTDVHIVKMSGAFQPTQEELRAHRNRLVIVATYESFRSFLFAVKNREYFASKQVFGGVVVDEVHTLGDEERGWKLESMLYQLRSDHKARLCCLSGTFTEKDAKVWSDHLGCQLIYRNPFRKFPYVEVVKWKAKKVMTPEEQRMAREEKIELTLRECWRFIVDDSIANMKLTDSDEVADYKFLETSRNGARDDFEEGHPIPEVLDAKLLIFCYSRRFSEKMAWEINRTFQFFFTKYFTPKQSAKLFSCQFIHAGIERREQAAIFDQFKTGKGIRILCCSPILETGIDVENIKSVIVTDAERYTATQLAQMVGRSREIEGNVIFLVAGESPEVIQRKKRLSAILQRCMHFIEAHLTPTDAGASGRLSRTTPGRLLIQCASHEDALALVRPISVFLDAVYGDRLPGAGSICSYFDATMGTEYHRIAIKGINATKGIQIICTERSRLPASELPEFPHIDALLIADPRRLGFIAPYIYQQYPPSWPSEAPIIYLEFPQDVPAPPCAIWQLMIDSDTAGAFQELSTEGIRKSEVPSIDPKIAELVDTLPNIWPYYSRERFYATKVRLNQPLTGFQDRSAQNLYITGFHLNNIPPRITPNKIPRVLLELLFRHEWTKKQIRHALAPYEGVGFDLNVILHTLLENGFIRRNRRRNQKGWGGRYMTTYIGDAVVTMGLDLEVAERMLGFFLADILIATLFRSCFWGFVPARKSRKEFNTYYKRLLVEEIIRQEEPWKRQPARKFMQRYDVETLAENKENRDAYRITKGDEEMLRRKGIWLSRAFQALYNGMFLHQEASRKSNRDYHQQKLKPYTESHKTHHKKARQEFFDMQQRFRRVIRKFQRKNEVFPRKPELTAYSRYRESSQYQDPVRQYLETVKGEGALVQEIQKKLGGPITSIYSTLTRTLKLAIFREKENEAFPHRRPYRYWLKQHKPSLPKAAQCKDCKFFVEDPTKRASSKGIRTWCKRTQSPRTDDLYACERFKPEIENILRFSEFEVIRKRGQRERVRCPQCKEWGTLLIPTSRYLTICKHCQTLFRQTKQKRFIGLAKMYIHEDRKQFRDGLPVIYTRQIPQFIFLERHRKLEVHWRGKAQVPTVFEYYRNQFRKMYLFEEIREVLVELGTLSADDERILREHGIPVQRHSEEDILRNQAQETRARRFCKALQNLEGGRLFEKALELILAKIRSNIAYTLELGKNVLPHELALELTFQQLDHATHAFFAILEGQDTRDPNKLIRQLRAYEGNAEKSIWAAIGHALPAALHFKGRQAGRYVRTALYYGAKAFDPFNAALNYLYHKLAWKVADTLAMAGFSKYWPGPGLLHRRGRRGQTKRFVRSKRNREIIFDFMDAYRPPFRHYLMKAFREGIISEEEIACGKDEWERQVYYIAGSVKLKLDRLFIEICQRKFFYPKKGWVKPHRHKLCTIMLIEAREFAQFIIDGSGNHTPFQAFEDREILQYIELMFGIIGQIATYTPPSAPYQPKHLALEEEQEMGTVPSLRRALPWNIVVVTHNDWDGFTSALLLMARHHQHLPNVHVLVADNNPHSRFFIKHIIKWHVRRLLVPDAYNVVIVADFALNWRLQFFEDLIRCYHIEVGSENRCELRWYDHHANPKVDPELLRNELGISVMHDTAIDTFQIIWADLQDQFKTGLGMLLMIITVLLKGVGLGHFWKLIGLKTLLQALDATLHYFTNMLQPSLQWDLMGDPLTTSEIQESPRFLQNWFNWYQHYWRKESPRRKNWAKLFSAIYRLNTPPAPSALKAVPLALEDRLLHSSLHHTAANQSFRTMILTAPASFPELLTLIPEPHPDALLVQWYNYTYSIRSLDPQKARVSGLLLDQGDIRAHETTGPIYFPRKPAFRSRNLGLVFYQFCPIDELTERLTKSRLSSDPDDLFITTGQELDAEQAPLPSKYEIIRNEAERFARELAGGRADKFQSEQLDVLPTTYFDEPLDQLARLSISFPKNKTLQIARGEVTLLFTQGYHRFKLNFFLQYLLRHYLTMEVGASSKSHPRLLYLDTLDETLQVKHLILSSTTKAGLEAICYRQFDDFTLLNQFITQELRDLILQANIKVVVIRDLLGLFQERLSHEILTPGLFWFRQSQEGKALIKNLRQVAADTGTCILLTELGAHRDEDPYSDEMVPNIPLALRQELHQYLYFTQSAKEFRINYRAPDASKKYRIDRPAPADVTAGTPAFLKEVIWNLHNLELVQE